jgi:hypothetical protein
MDEKIATLIEPCLSTPKLQIVLFYNTQLKQYYIQSEIVNNISRSFLKKHISYFVKHVELDH